MWSVEGRVGLGRLAARVENRAPSSCRQQKVDNSECRSPASQQLCSRCCALAGCTAAHLRRPAALGGFLFQHVGLVQLLQPSLRSTVCVRCHMLLMLGVHSSPVMWRCTVTVDSQNPLRSKTQDSSSSQPVPVQLAIEV
jgi:hypothetical protein